MRVSTRMTSPSFRNSGTRTTAPVSSLAGFWPPVAVSPRTPGSVSTILSSTCAGALTDSGTPFHSMTVHIVPSLSHMRGVAHRFLAGGVLLEVVRHHEVPEIAVAVEILHLRFLDVGAFDGVAGLHVALERAARLQVADAHAVERLALAGLDELVLDDHVRVAVEHDLEAGLEFVRAVGGHGVLRLDTADAVEPGAAGPTMAGCRWLAAHDTRNPPRSVTSARRLATGAAGLRQRSRRNCCGSWGSARNGSSRPGRAAARFPLRVPRGYVARMRRGDPHDPLLRQVLPLAAELAETRATCRPGRRPRGPWPDRACCTSTTAAPCW